MPDARLQHTRAAYDGHAEAAVRIGRLLVGPDGLLGEQPFAPGLTLRAQSPWRAPHLNDAEQLARRAEYLTDRDTGDEDANPTLAADLAAIALHAIRGRFAASRMWAMPSGEWHATTHGTRKVYD